MHFNFKKVIAGSLATAMLITNFSINSLANVSAANEAYPTSGKCGDNIDWLINSDGVLVISGDGEMKCPPDDWGWAKFSDSIKEVVIENGITSTTDDSLIPPFGETYCSYISKIILPPSFIRLKRTLDYVYHYKNLKDIYIYSKNIIDTAYQIEYQPYDYQCGTIWHVYKGSDTEKSLRNDLKLTDEDIEYIPDNEQMPTVNNKTAVELEPVSETSGPSGLFSKWEWDETSKTLTFSGKDRITIADDYKQYAEETEHIVINEGITHLNANTGIVTVSGSGANSYYSGSFTGFTSLKDVKLPETLQEISASSFRGDTSLEEINFPKALNKIGEGAFGYCSKLKLIKLNEGMTIGGSAFTVCESLKEVTIPKNVTFEPVTFGGAGLVRAHSTFSNCTGIEKVVIEDGSVLKDTWNKVYTQDGIPENFFQGCSSLKTVIIKGDVDYIAGKAFGGTFGKGCPSITDIYLYNTNLATITAKGTRAGIDESYGYNDSFDTTNNPTFHVVKGSQTEETLRNAGYLNDENTVYLTDFTALDAKIKEADNLDTSKYTNDSVTALKSAIDSGKTVLNNENATQEQVDSALTAIENAIKNLKSKVSPTIPTGNAPIVTTTRSPEVVQKDKTTAENLMKQAKITKLKVKSKSKKKINVTWKKVKTAVGYQVQVSKKSNFKKRILNKFTTKKKLTINKKLKSGKTYFVRVRAYATYKDAFGKPQKVYSKWNKKLRKVKVK